METFTLSRKGLQRQALLKALCGGRLTKPRWPPPSGSRLGTSGG